MAKLSLSQCPKFKLLVRSLSLPTPYVRGHLEMMWESAHFRDNAHFPSFDEIEAAAEWQGEAGVFAQILLDRNWIDKSENGFSIHDYEDHLPHYVTERRRQRNYRKTITKQSQDNTVLSRDNNSTVVRQYDLREEKRSVIKDSCDPLVDWIAHTYSDIKNVERFVSASRDAYPKIDLLDEAKKAYAWEVADPKRTKKYHSKFLNNWWRNYKDPVVKPAVDDPGSVWDRMTPEGFTR